MLDLLITWPEGEERFTPADSPVRIGRSSEAHVTLTQGSVSRRHLELIWDSGHWMVNDPSTHGSYETDGMRRPPKWVVEGDIGLRLGGTEGVAVRINPVPPGTPAAGDTGEQSEGGSRSGVDPDGPDGGLRAAVSTPAAARPGSTLVPASSSGGEAALGMPAFEMPGPRPASGLSTNGPSGPAASSAGVSATPSPSALAPAPAPEPTGTQPAIKLDPDGGPVSETALRLSVDGQDFSFPPGAEVTVGRDPTCMVQVEERHSLVSRRHLRIVHRDDAWWIEDYSSKGTWVDRRRLRGPYRAQGAFVANLGDDDAGTPMRIVTAGHHRSAPNPNLVLMGVLGAAVLIPLMVLVFILARSNPEPDFDSAKQATVVLFGLEGGQGSGFFVDDDLIVTNQHVAALSSQLLVGVSRDLDEPAQIEYATELVAQHPFLDIAVLRIANDAVITSTGPQISPDPVGDIGLPVVELGDSADLSIGDEVYSTGFPGRLGITSTDDVGDLRLPAVVATRGEVANFGIWPGCSNPDLTTFIPADSPPGVTCSAGGDIERGVLLSSFASGQGASGSPVFSDDQVIGVVYAGAPEEANASLNIATSTFQSWLDEIVDTGR